jgi:hypothetical protein
VLAGVHQKLRDVLAPEFMDNGGDLHEIRARTYDVANHHA